MGKTFIGKAEVIKTAKDGYQAELDNEWRWLCFLNGYGKSAYGPPRPARITSCNLVKPIGYEDGENLSPAMRDFYRNKTFVMSRAPGRVFEDVVAKLSDTEALAAYLHAFNFILELERLDVTSLASSAMREDYSGRKLASLLLPNSLIGKHLQDQGLLEPAQQLLTAHALRARPCLRHRDLHAYNALYDAKTRTFTPIDFGMMDVTTDLERFYGLRISKHKAIYELARQYYREQSHNHLSFGVAKPEHLVGFSLSDMVFEKDDVSSLVERAEYKQLISCLKDISALPTRIDEFKPCLTPQQINEAADQGFAALKELVCERIDVVPPSSDQETTVKARPLLRRVIQGLSP